MLTRLAAALLAMLAGCHRTPSPTPVPVPVPPPTPVPPVPGPQLLLAEHNAARTLRNFPPLAWSEQLAAAAQAHAESMARRGILAHEGIGDGTPWDRMTAAGYAWSNAAENAAEGPDTPTVMNLWMADAPHRANVLGPYRDMGAGFADGPGGERYWCVDFGTPR